MTDAETQAAIDALIYRVKARDKAIQDGEDHPDAEPFALEFVTALRGQGWRKTPAKAVGWKEQQHGGEGLPVSEEARSLVAAYRAKVAAEREPQDGEVA